MVGNCDPICSVDDSPEDFDANYKPKDDLLKALTIFATALAGAAAINHSWVEANQVSNLLSPSSNIAFLFHCLIQTLSSFISLII
jgi:hypothetical protein